MSEKTSHQTHYLESRMLMFPEEELKRLGIQQSKESIRFQNLDEKGEVISWVSRKTNSSKKEAFVQSTGTPQLLWPHHLLKKGYDMIFLTEGHEDALAMRMIGLEAYSVNQGGGSRSCLCDNKLTGKIIYLAFDSDGKSNLLWDYATQKLSGANMVLCIDWGEYKDANNMLQKLGLEAFKFMVEYLSEKPLIRDERIFVDTISNTFNDGKEDHQLELNKMTSLEFKLYHHFNKTAIGQSIVLGNIYQRAHYNASSELDILSKQAEALAEKIYKKIENEECEINKYL
jgi:hypothetical protein